jgi:hypothetical protein
VDHCWEEFTKWAEKEDIDINDDEDYGPWWRCWQEAWKIAQLVT